MSHLALTKEQTFLMVIDVQERLVPAMAEAERAQVVARCARLVEGAQLLGLPVLVTEQYPKGLGGTVPAVRDVLRSGTLPIEKLEFDATQNESVRARLEQLRSEGRTKAVVCGMEAHICVYQTARGLHGGGFATHVAFDAIASREQASREIARSLLHYAGAIVTSSEAVLFDLVGRAGNDAFKAISRLVK